ncbi:MAG: hypothetical protein LBQ75_06915, partial [Zoogloeaceae bacterium]|jgi:hypothetical protein|nr:hypothetical protein [Zoogloeaceae bacterium]
VLAGLYAGYRRKVPDLFMLAGGALSLIVVGMTWLGRILLMDGSRGLMSVTDSSNFFILGLISMLATAGAAYWLRQVAREMKENERQALQGKPTAENNQETSP